MMRKRSPGIESNIFLVRFLGEHRPHDRASICQDGYGIFGRDLSMTDDVWKSTALYTRLTIIPAGFSTRKCLANIF